MRCSHPGVTTSPEDSDSDFQVEIGTTVLTFKTNERFQGLQRPVKQM